MERNSIFECKTNSPVKYVAEILLLIEVAVIHYRVQQKENHQITQGNNKADQEAKETALMSISGRNKY